MSTTFGNSFSKPRCLAKVVVAKYLDVDKDKFKKHHQVRASIDDSLVDGAEGVLCDSNILHQVVQVDVQSQDTFQFWLELASIEGGELLADGSIVASHTGAGVDEKGELHHKADHIDHQCYRHGEVGFARQIAKVYNQHGKEIEVDGEVEGPEVVGSSEQLVEPDIIGHQGLKSTTSRVQATGFGRTKAIQNIALQQDDIVGKQHQQGLQGHEH